MPLSWLPLYFLNCSLRLIKYQDDTTNLSPHTDFCQFWVTETIVFYMSSSHPPPPIIHIKWFSALNGNADSCASQLHASSWGWWFTHLRFIFSSPEVVFHGFQTASHLFSLTVMKKTDVKQGLEGQEVEVGGVKWWEMNRAESIEFWNPQSCWKLKLPPDTGRDQLSDPLLENRL